RRPINMVFGIDRGFDAAVFLGYHAAAGSLHASFDHTYSGSKFSEIIINGRKASEFYINALIAGSYGVPVIMVGGDDVLESDVKELAPWAQYVRFKEAVTRHSNITPSIERIRADIIAKIPSALRSIKPENIIKLSSLKVKYKLKNTSDADIAEWIPGLKRTDAYTLEYECNDAVLAYKMMQVISNIS
ncbi:MAG: M55 family metallopeptidase, partial [Candidatus Parvarchaeota archaeon]